MGASPTLKHRVGDNETVGQTCCRYHGKSQRIVALHRATCQEMIYRVEWFRLISRGAYMVVVEFGYRGVSTEILSAA